MSKWIKIVIGLGVVIALVLIIFMIFSTVMNINNCAGIICINIGG